MIGLTDAVFLGRVGDVALGACALGGVYYMAMFMLAFGFGFGAQIIIARRNGERRYKMCIRDSAQASPPPRPAHR